MSDCRRKLLQYSLFEKNIFSHANSSMTLPDHKETSKSSEYFLLQKKKPERSVLYKGINNLIYKEKRVMSRNPGKSKKRSENHTVQKKHTSVEKQLIMTSYSSPSENVPLLKMKAGRPPAEEQWPRSPKARAALETSAPGRHNQHSPVCIFTGQVEHEQN